MDGQTRSEWSPERIRNVRTLLTLSQEGMGALLGVHGGTVSKWETGKQVPLRAFRAKLDQLAKEHAAPQRLAGATLDDLAQQRATTVAGNG